MIFQHTWEHVLNGTKTQTRRIVKPNERQVATEFAVVTDDRAVYEVGKTYAVQPGRGKRAVWYRKMPAMVQTICDAECPASIRQYSDSALKFDGWQPLRIKITAIRRQDVRQISEHDALAEGGFDPQSYLCLWAEMHDPSLNMYFEERTGSFVWRTRRTKRGGEWDGIDADNLPALLNLYNTRPAERYDAWVLDFERCE